jgi:hypothetical protein
MALLSALAKDAFGEWCAMLTLRIELPLPGFLTVRTGSKASAECADTASAVIKLARQSLANGQISHLIATTQKPAIKSAP